MFELISIILAFIGSVIAGLWDLLTTEVPDEVPVLMVSSGIFLWFFYGIAFSDFVPLFFSLVVGTGLLAFGLILYRYGHWGGADAWLLAAIGYLIPFYGNELFIPGFIFNFLVVGTIYMVGYSLVLGFMDRKAFSYLGSDIKDNWKVVLAPIIIFMLFESLLLPYVDIISVTWVTIIFLFLIIFWRYARVIDRRIFRKRIATKALRVGDVLDDMKWVGLTEKEVEKVRKERRFVVIKEGVRFVPAFPIALTVSLLYGNLMFLFFSL